jgi:hypothetical protein
VPEVDPTRHELVNAEELRVGDKLVDGKTVTYAKRVKPSSRLPEMVRVHVDGVDLGHFQIGAPAMWRRRV